MNRTAKIFEKYYNPSDLTAIFKFLRKKLIKAEKETDDEESLKILPPISAGELSDFEQKHQIQLPEIYKQLLENVCGGIQIDGEPGLFSLADSETSLQYDQTNLQAAFPYSQADARFLLTKMENLGEDFRDFYYSKENSVRQEGFPNGCLVLTDYGCNDYTVLVINGEEYGALWRAGEYDFPEHSGLYDAENGDSQPLRFGFLEWFCYWCDLQWIEL